MSKIIIGIHGLGNKPSKETLEKWWLESMCEGLENINKFEFVPKFEIIYWADILNDKPLNEKITDKENPYFLDEKYIPASKDFVPEEKPLRKKVLSFLEEQMDKIFLNDDLSQNFEFVSEMIFKKYFKELDIYYTKEEDTDDITIKTAKTNIRNRLTEVLEKNKGKDILLIAHSMGSIIAYDVCNFITTDIEVDTLVTMGSPLGMPIIVSKIAEEQNDKMIETTKLKTPPNIRRKWINYSDIDDSVALNYNLHDDYDANINGVSVEDNIVHNNYEINGEGNPHKSYGYLRTPEFSNLLSEFLTSDISAFELWRLKTTDKIVKFLKKIMDK